MNRRDFIKNIIAAAAGSSFLLGRLNRLFAKTVIDESVSYPDLIAVKGSTPGVMLDSAMEVFGGMSRVVKKGQTVAVKPNIGWDTTPERGANTNPDLVKRVIEHCYDAGAEKVYVFDHSCNYWKDSYRNSGIGKAAVDAGAVVSPAHSRDYYRKIDIPGAETLTSAEVHKLVLDSDVFINVPVLKHHGSARMTAAMKNLMGAVWDRSRYHRSGLHRCIADFCLFRKPDLNIVDAYRVMTQNGPRGIFDEDVELKKMLLVSKDIVAVDAAAALIYGLKPEEIPYIVMGAKQGSGEMGLDRLDIKRIVL